MHQEKYSLTWNTYSYHMKSMIQELMMNEDFSYVTLVTEDKKQIKANIGVLSAFSPFFNDILKKDKNIDQIIYLRGIQYSEMESIMQFIYHGKATFFGERMEEFLAVAKSLEIKELCNAETNDEIDLDDEPPLSEQVQVVKSEDKILISDHTNEQASQVKGGVISKNRKYECKQCHKIYPDKSTLSRHKRSVHDGVQYACNQCEYKATQKCNLILHIQSKHEGKRYPCEQCEYIGSHSSGLYKHIQSKHVGVKYTCDQCKYQFSQKGKLREHIKNKHKGVTYDEIRSVAD